MKIEKCIEPGKADQTSKMKPQAVAARTFGKGEAIGERKSDGICLKERQSAKIKELSDALVAAGFVSLDEQASALGLSRSTTWTILRAKHKNYGLSAALIYRLLQLPKLDRYVRATIIEYVQEKASGSYGHNQVQLRRFLRRLTDLSGIELEDTTVRGNPKKGHCPSRPRA